MISTNGFDVYGTSSTVPDSSFTYIGRSCCAQSSWNNLWEWGGWGVAFTTNQRTSLCVNEQAYYGTSNFSVNCSATSYVGPGDLVPGSRAWYGLRAFSAGNAATAQKLVTVRRASDNNTCDLLATTTGTPGNTANCTTTGSCAAGACNGLSAATFCNATTCSVTKAYDHTFAGACTGTCDASQGTAAKQPTIAFSCVGTTACMQGTNAANTFLQATGNTTPIAIPYSVSAVAKRTGDFTNTQVVYECTNVGQLSWNNTVNTGYLYNGATATFAMSDSTTHATQGVFNGTSSAANVDGVDTTSLNAGGNSCTGAFKVTVMSDQTAALYSLTGNLSEAGMWNIGFTAGNRTTICQNQQTYYGSGNFGAVC
jgi:hypothetical protein